MNTERIKQVNDKLIELFGINTAWKVELQDVDNIVSCEQIGKTCVSFNFMPDGSYQIEVYLPEDGEILTYDLDDINMAVMFYQSHVDHLTAIRAFVADRI